MAAAGGWRTVLRCVVRDVLSAPTALTLAPALPLPARGARTVLGSPMHQTAHVGRWPTRMTSRRDDTDIARARTPVDRPSGTDDTGTDAATDDAGAEVWALVRSAQAGDADAFGAIYDRYLDTVYRYVYYRVADHALAEDLTSETFLRALRRLSGVTYQGRDLAAWLVTIARNLIFDHTKSARYRLEFATDDFAEGGAAAITSLPEDGPEALLLTKLTNHRLLEAVRELPDEQQECIVLRFLQGLNVAETAEVMGKNEGAVKAMQHRAVRRLHSTLAGELS